MQTAVDRIFRAIGPDDVYSQLRVFCAESVVPPPAFDEVWSNVGYSDDGRCFCRFTNADTDDTNVVLVVADLAEVQHILAIKALLHFADRSGEFPLIVLIPVNTQKARPPVAELRNMVVSLLPLGINEVIFGEPSGFAFALAVRTKLNCLETMGQNFDLEYEKRWRMVKAKGELEQRFNFAMWEYAPRKLQFAIPAPCAGEVAGPRGPSVNGFVLKRGIFRTRNVTLYEIEPPPGVEPEGPAGEMMKVLSKSNLKTLGSVISLHQSFHIMDIVSAEWGHPNIVQLLEMYQSPSSIYYRMERCGQETLFRRLVARDKGQRGLSEEQVTSICVQFVSAIDHLHRGPRVCHRDIKPENSLCQCEGDEITVKLMDFDLAIQPGSMLCVSPCGTFPFVAPEVVEGPYDGFKADMWGLGVMIVETVTAVRTVEDRMGVTAPTSGCGWDESAGPPVEVVRELAARLSAPGAVYSLVADPEDLAVRPRAMAYANMTRSLLDSNPAARCTSDVLLEDLVRLSQSERSCARQC